MYGRSLIITSHVWTCKVLLSLSFWATGTKSKNYFQNFVHFVQLLESNNCNATTNDFKPKKIYWWMLWISMVRTRMVLQKLQHFITWLAGISTDFYYKEFIEIGAKTVFYLALGLKCEGYWPVNSRRSIFADPNIGSY